MLTKTLSNISFNLSPLLLKFNSLNTLIQLINFLHFFDSTLTLEQNCIVIHAKNSLCRLIPRWLCRSRSIIEPTPIDKEVNCLAFFFVYLSINIYRTI